MARNKESAKPVVTPRLVVRVLLAGALLLIAAYAWTKTEQFLIRDARFVVAIPDYGLESPSLQIAGLQYTSRVQVLRVFADDFGRSLYLLPLSARRAQLRDLDWVKDATVSRLWPNRIFVQIIEREPVAFVNRPASDRGVMRIGLIDEEGKFLPPPEHARFNLPVVRGIRSEESIYDRRARVHRLMALMKELGPVGARISEVDVTDPADLKVTVNVDQHAVTLMLGDHNFLKRMQNFENYYKRIQERLPARKLDLRLEDRITVVEGSKDDE